MSDVTTTGLDALYAATRGLDGGVQGRLRAVAGATADRVQKRAQQILGEKTHGTGNTARAIGVVEDRSRKQFQVISQAPPGAPSLLPVWIEYGTKFQPARAYMRPAADAERLRYEEDMLTAAVAVVRDALG